MDVAVNNGAALVSPDAVALEMEEVREAAQGDADSFMRLYQRYVRSVYHYFAARLGDHHAAEEATALTFERTWQSLPRFRAPGSFAGWLFTIARRVRADYYRQQARAGRQQQALLILRATPPANEPEAVVLRSEQRQQILTVLQTLKPVQQDVLCLRFFADQPYATIALTLGKSEAAVKMLAYRALDELKRRITDESHEL